jgi:hypothetical protein
LMLNLYVPTVKKQPNYICELLLWFSNNCPKYSPKLITLFVGCVNKETSNLVLFLPIQSFKIKF